MAIFHCSTKPVSRATGRSVVAAAAYRAGVELTNERDGRTHDYTGRHGVAHAEIVLPSGVSAKWAQDRSALWNAAEAAEKRRDARVAREFEIALPHELTAEQRQDLARAFAQDLANRYGAAVDFAIHEPQRAGDIRNYHAHLMMTTREVTSDGLGEKTMMERKNSLLLAQNLPTTQMQVRDIRQAWEMHANEHLYRAGVDARIDHRSHQERGLELEPTHHAGVHASQMERRGLAVDRARIDAAAAARNAELIRQKPEQVLTLITNGQSVFDRHDIARTLHRYIGGDAQAFQNAFAQVMASPAIVELQAANENQLARYSTREIVNLEAGMVQAAERLQEARGFKVEQRQVNAAVAHQEAQLNGKLSDEQRSAVEHVTGSERIAVVVGLAGAGKSTMLAAARDAWESAGYNVRGAALAGKAAEGLQESAGIESRTLASWEKSWQRGFEQLSARDVFVIDEAGMLGSRQLSRFVEAAETAGAKIVLVGDHQQLQAIEAGAAFRAIAEKTGFAELSEIRRQHHEWQRAASVDFGRLRTAEGLAAYQTRGAVHLEETTEKARAAIVRDVIADMQNRPDGSRLVLAHRRADVDALNGEIRAIRQARGELTDERLYQTADGKRAFAAGDRILFKENNRDLNVKNGMLGTVEQVEDGRLNVRLDQGRTLALAVREYTAIDHGYATTIHKSQGATVDRAFVLASGTMDRHLTYVAMTRHRDEARLYGGRDEFANEEKLTARLSRAQSKETTLDYSTQADTRHPSAKSPLERAQEIEAARNQVGEGGASEKSPLERARELIEAARRPHTHVTAENRLEKALEQAQAAQHVKAEAKPEVKLAEMTVRGPKA